MIRKATSFLLSFLLIFGTMVQAAEFRPWGGPGPLNGGDFLLGTGYWDSPGGRRVYRLNADHLPFSQDNAIKLGNANLYGLSYGVSTAYSIPYMGASGALGFLSLTGAGYCLKSAGTTSAPVWGTCGSSTGSDYDESNVHITGGWVYANYFNLDGRGNVNKTVPWYWGWDEDNPLDPYYWTQSYIGTYHQMRFITNESSADTLDRAMFRIAVNGSGGSLPAGQRIFGVDDYLTNVFKVSKGGNVEAAGEVRGAYMTTSSTDGKHRINVSNSTGYTGDGPSPGDFTCVRADNTCYVRADDNTAWIDLRAASSSSTYGYITFGIPNEAGSAVAWADNTAKSITFAHGAAVTNNCAFYHGWVPDNFDNTVAVVAKVKVAMGGDDSSKTQNYYIGMSGTQEWAGSYGELSNLVNITWSGSASNYELITIGSTWNTMTSWAGSLTSGNAFTVGLCRAGDTSDTSTNVTRTALVIIRYGVTE